MKKKPLASIFPDIPLEPHASPLSFFTASILLGTLGAHALHSENSKPHYYPPDDHLEDHHNRAPVPSGKPTAWVMSTSTAVGSFSISDLASFPIKQR